MLSLKHMIESKSLMLLKLFLKDTELKRLYSRQVNLSIMSSAALVTVEIDQTSFSHKVKMIRTYHFLYQNSVDALFPSLIAALCSHGKNTSVLGCHIPESFTIPQLRRFYMMKINDVFSITIVESLHFDSQSLLTEKIHFSLKVFL